MTKYSYYFWMANIRRYIEVDHDEFFNIYNFLRSGWALEIKEITIGKTTTYNIYKEDELIGYTTQKI